MGERGASPQTYKERPCHHRVHRDRACLMTAVVRETGTAFSDLVLRTTPPRAPRHQVVRPRLSLDAEHFAEIPVILVQAPPGFGKTSLLGQWRREHLAKRAAVAWFSADERDDLQRFLHGLVLAVRTGCARPTFGRFLLEGGGPTVGEMEGVTAWLAEVALTSLDLALIVDEAERLSTTNLYALTYLLHNIPPILRVVVASRVGPRRFPRSACSGRAGGRTPGRRSPAPGA